MIIILQLLVLSLIILSFVMIVAIPVILGSPKDWEQSKNLIYLGAGLWTSLLLLTGIVNSFVI
jgi:photosystem II PsbZ protein|uniref:Photosystem II reaction center protein Z n=1 Tax=Galdieria yellowstonensis TaxID=3028027 RepID=A0A9Y1MXT3_9RHOD|nr:Ycf9 [Galdieria yellowstonensis]WDA99419.1 Ycf9 [Galdieria yellowstonensis]